jgi:hypothetical protein
MDVNLSEAHARIATADGMPARLERTAASLVRIASDNGSQQMLRPTDLGAAAIGIKSSKSSEARQPEQFTAVNPAMRGNHDAPPTMAPTFI